MVLNNENSLRAEDVAEILQIGRNAVYDLAKSGELRSYRIGRKLRFTYTAIQDYIESSSSGGASPTLSALRSGAQQSSQFTICGYDIIVDTLIDLMKKQGHAASRMSLNSYDALHALYKDEVSAACCHLVDQSTGEYNFTFIKHLLPGCPCVVLRLAHRTQGFIVAEGNPKNLTSWEDLGRKDIVIANREIGSGARMLLDYQLKTHEITVDTVNGYDSSYEGEVTAGAAVAQGRADVAIGRAQTASQFSGLDFVPMHIECYDLVIKEKTLSQPDAKALLSIIASGELQNIFECANGYNMSSTGRYFMLPA